MTRTFDLALHRAKNMSRPRPPKITFTERSTEIDFNRNPMPMAGGGGLSSVQNRMNIGGQPHKLAYINSDEASLLKQMGGLGEPVQGTRGVPAYIGVGDEEGISEDYGPGGSMDTGSGDQSLDMGEMGSSEEYTEDKAREAAAAEEETSGLLGLGILTPENFQNFLGRLGAGALGTVIGGPLGGFLGHHYGPEVYEWAKKEGYLDFKGDPESPDFKGTIDEFLTEPDYLYPDPEEKKIIAEEEEREKEEKVGMDRYFQVMRGKTPLGYTENEKRILARIYPPDHPIWKDINREREPMFPDLDPDPDSLPPPPDWDPIYGPPRIDPPRLIPHDPDKPNWFHIMTDEEEVV